MGIDITCGECIFSCSYGYWNEIRAAAIKATLEYVKSINNFEEGSNDYVNQNEILEFLDIVCDEEKYCEDLPQEYKSSSVMKLLHYGEIPVVDLFVYFGLVGIIAFCNKSDCQGFYSVGNSYDICDLFKLIKPFFIKNTTDIVSPENHLYNCIIEIEKVFQESVEKKQIVVIC
jgi:hypothetical protein